MDFESVALENPYLPEKDSLTVEVLWQGQPASDIQVSLFFLPGNGTPPGDTERRLFRTDDLGRVTVDLPEAGQYLLSAVYLEPVETPDAMWKSYWASLTFDTSDVAR